jgi:hypothetical protein
MFVPRDGGRPDFDFFMASFAAMTETWICINTHLLDPARSPPPGHDPCPRGHAAWPLCPRYIPRRNAEGGGRVSCTRLALLAEDRKRALPTRPPGDLSPSVPLSGTPDGRGSLARDRPPLPSLTGPIRCPGGFPVGTGPTPLRCVTRTAGRNAGGFPGRHPGTAAGPFAGLPRAKDFAGAGADHLPRRPAPVPRRRPSAGRDGWRIKVGIAAGMTGRVMPAGNRR